MGSLVIFAVLLVAMYAVMIRPQQRRLKAQREMLAALKEGDLVLTASGIYGVITELSDTDAYIEVAQGIELKMTRSSIAGKVRVDDESDADGGDTGGKSDKAVAAAKVDVKDGEASKPSGIAKVLGLGR